MVMVWHSVLILVVVEDGLVRMTTRQEVGNGFVS